ncbi:MULTISPECIES: hypothetical protein [unclassified Caballeronia]|uniref:hypothetical protein n=1 Tax=unclassified Caballeronia TaxID=2646786 RepID=UPI001F42B776|nr:MULTISPECIES: hypothetical protein [unclassified Caballeronia]MCE4547926.1 hypothetical protein [Caballeronia sp. PC1]MCE4575815.1 hypothetical protein [Caballeronia sp. CLC5]
MVRTSALLSISTLLLSSVCHADGYDHTVIYTGKANNGAVVHLRLFEGDTGAGVAIVESRFQVNRFYETLTYRVAWGRNALAGAGDSVRVWLPGNPVVHLYCGARNLACASEESFVINALGVSAQQWERTIEEGG